MDDAHTYPNSSGLAPGVYPQTGDRAQDFTVVGGNGRKLAVCDLGGHVDVGGVHVSDPDLAEVATRLRLIGERRARLVWVATIRHGIDYHRPSIEGRTACGRSQRTGELIPASRAMYELSCSPCPRCWSPAEVKDVWS